MTTRWRIGVVVAGSAVGTLGPCEQPATRTTTTQRLKTTRTRRGTTVAIALKYYAGQAPRPRNITAISQSSLNCGVAVAMNRGPGGIMAIVPELTRRAVLRMGVGA